ARRTHRTRPRPCPSTCFTRERVLGTAPAVTVVNQGGAKQLPSTVRLEGGVSARRQTAPNKWRSRDRRGERARSAQAVLLLAQARTALYALDPLDERSCAFRYR